MGERGIFILLSLLLLSTGARPADAQQLLTQEEALRLAFPNAVVERRTAYLDESELREAAQLAGRGVDVRQNVVTHYVGRRGGEYVGAAYFDAHRVRTVSEVVMIVVSPRGTVSRIEVLQFLEPPEYRPPPPWLKLFEGRRLDAELSLRRGIPNMTGATLTSEAVADAARRILALHEVIRPFDDPAGNASR